VRPGPNRGRAAHHPVLGEVVFVAEVVVGLNQQQLELVDKTVVRLGLGSREELLRLALREFFAENPPELKEGR
jgi:hypothetical protein